MALELGTASIVATAQSSVRRLPTIVAKKKDEALIGGGDEQKKPPPVGGGGLAAEGTKVPLFQFYQSTWKRVPNPLTVAPSNPFFASSRPFPRSAGVVE